ncbi:hypothetical protein F3G63_35040, partial [Pseudomonas aeruginosa]
MFLAQCMGRLNRKNLFNLLKIIWLKIQWYKFNFIKLYGIRMKEEYKMENTKEQMLISAGELILQAFGKDLQDPSLKETPKRFAKMMLEQLEGE